MNEIKITYEMISKKINAIKIRILPGYEASVPEFIVKYRDRVKRKGDIIAILCRNNKLLTLKEFALFVTRCDLSGVPILDQADLFDSLKEVGMTWVKLAQKYIEGNKLSEDEIICWDIAWSNAMDRIRIREPYKIKNRAKNRAIDKQVDYLLELFKEKENGKN